MYQLQIDGLQHHLVFQSQLIETGTRAAGIRACLGGVVLFFNFNFNKADCLKTTPACRLLPEDNC